MQADELNLLEDGLQLWLIALRNAPAAHTAGPLLDLFPNLTAVMERSTGLPPPHASLPAVHLFVPSGLLCIESLVGFPIHPSVRVSIHAPIHPSLHPFTPLLVSIQS